MEVIILRSIRLGPKEAVVADTLIVGVHFEIPADAVLTYASVGPISIGVPPVATSISLYFTKDEASTTYPHPLKTGQSSRNPFRPMPLIWEGRLKLESNYEHTLDMSVYNLTGVPITIQGICDYEVDE